MMADDHLNLHVVFDNDDVPWVVYHNKGRNNHSLQKYTTLFLKKVETLEVWEVVKDRWRTAILTYIYCDSIFRAPLSASASQPSSTESDAHPPW